MVPGVGGGGPRGAGKGGGGMQNFNKQKQGSTVFYLPSRLFVPHCGYVVKTSVASIQIMSDPDDFAELVENHSDPTLH